jgi:hypothetical protein
VLLPVVSLLLLLMMMMRGLLPSAQLRQAQRWH